MQEKAEQEERVLENENLYEKPVTLKNILKFAVPTIAMTVFMSFYTMVDGLFVSNLIGTDALSAINLTAPVIQLVTAISTMLATGGSAVIRYPLISLMKTGRLELIERLFGEVQIPDAVYAELFSNPGFGEEAQQIKNSAFIRRVFVEDDKAVDLPRRATGLDIGESEAIILSDSCRADLLLMAGISATAFSGNCLK